MCPKCSDRPATFHISEITASEVKTVIPDRLFIPETTVSLYYVTRDFLLTVILAYFVWNSDVRLKSYHDAGGSQMLVLATKCLLWGLYWWFQSLTFTALWLIAHEVPLLFMCLYFLSPMVVMLLSAVMVPSLHTVSSTIQLDSSYILFLGHHITAGSIPIVCTTDSMDISRRTSMQNDSISHSESGLWETIEDTPIFQVVKLIFQQLFGFQSYLLFNISGQSRYPRWTNHYNPYSVIFRDSQRLAIVLSDIGILAIVLSLIRASQTEPLNAAAIFRLYGIPWLLLNHWVAMIVSLQHTDVVLPRYRDGAYTYARGALVTVDREFLGWQGKFFLHGVAHFHVVHHFFPTIPFYNLEEATRCAKKVLGKDYITCDTPVFLALWQNLRACQYVDVKGDIVFYKDKNGSAHYRSASQG